MALDRIAEHSANTNVIFRAGWNGKSRRVKPYRPLLQRNGDRIAYDLPIVSAMCAIRPGFQNPKAPGSK
jgi:hypothetical protein